MNIYILVYVFVIAADQVDVHLLRCQQLRLYILKAARALLSHQDKLRQILSQPAVIDVSPNPTGAMILSCCGAISVPIFITQSWTTNQTMQLQWGLNICKLTVMY